MSLTDIPTPTTILAPEQKIGEHQAVNLTRNTKGSRWDRIGDNELIDTDKFRYNYNPDTGIFEGRVIMGSWTSEVKDPINITDGGWDIHSELSVTTGKNSVIKGRNSTLVEKSTSDSGRNYHQDNGTLTGDDETVELLLEQGTASITEVGIRDNTAGEWAIRVQIDWSAETATITDGNGSVSVEKYSNDGGNGGKLLYVELTGSGTSGNNRVIFVYPAGSSGSDTGSIYHHYLGHFESASPPPTPVYGETADSTFAQSADDAGVSNLSDINLNADDNMFEVEFLTGKDSGVLFDLHSDGNNRMYAERNASDEIHFIVVDGGTTQADLNLGTVADDTEGKIVVGWKKDDIAGCLDGGTVQTDTSATIPSVTDLHIGRDYNDANYLNGGFIRHLTYPRKEDSATIQSLSR